MVLLFYMIFSHIEMFAISPNQLNIEEELNQFKQQTLLAVSTELETGIISNRNVVSMAVLCTSPNLKYNRKEKRIIERLIGTFPDTIIENDTLSFYIQHILRLSYNEFVKKDYRRASYVIDNFDNVLPPPEGWKQILDFSYPAIRGIFTRFRIEEKTKVKPKRSWIQSQQSLSNENDSIIINWKNNYQTLIFDIIKDIPKEFYDDKFILTVLYDEKVSSLSEISDFLFRTIDNDDEELFKFILSKWKFPIDKTKRKLVICGLSSYAKSKNAHKVYDNIVLCAKPSEQEEIINVSIMLSELISSNEIKSFSSNLLADTWILPCLEQYELNILEAIGDVFGIGSEEWYYINSKKKDDRPIFISLDKKEQIQIINNDIIQNCITKETSNNIFTIINQSYSRYDFLDVCEICHKYSSYIEKGDLPKFYNIWALSESNLGKYKNSIEHYKLALESGPNEYIKHTILLNLGYTFCEMGKYKEAIKIFDTYKITKGADFDNFIINDYYGYLYSYSDQQQALNYYMKAEKYLDETNLYTDKKIRHFVNKSKVIGSKYQQQKCLEQALSYCQDDWLAIDTIALGTIYMELGTFYNSIFKYKEANNYYTLAALCLSKLTKYDKRTCTLNLYRAINLIDLKEYDDAIKILEGLKTIKYDLLGDSNFEYFQIVQLLFKAYTLSNKVNIQHFIEYNNLLQIFPFEKESLRNLDVMALYYISAGEYTQAVALLENILNNSKYPSTIKLISRIISILDKLPVQQYDLLHWKIFKHLKNEIISTFTQLSATDRTEMAILLNKILNHSLNGISRHSQYANIQFELSLFTKGLLFHTQQEISMILENDKKAVDDWEKVKDLRNSLNQAVTHGDSTQIQSLQSQIERIERDLTNKFVGLRQLRKKLDVRRRDVLSGIGKNGLAIDFIRYTRNDTIKYGAFIFSHKLNNALFVPICTEQQIKSKSQNGNKIDYTFYRKKDKSKGESYRLIWGNLEEYFTDYNDIYFSGDGLLNQLAIEYLCDENDTQISNKYRLHRVFHLADIRKSIDIGNTFVALGVSDFNTAITRAIPNGTRGEWGPLDNVKEELRLIQGIFKDDNTIKSRFVLNDSVNERFVKSLSNTDISTLHIATHGFYKDKKMLEYAILDETHDDYYAAHRAFLVGKDAISGLVLREGNVFWKLPEITSDEDDILTSDEIENLTFPNLKLTVLSACETGLGNVDSEGVWGLQRAFRIAGTESLICSLCKIDDFWTRVFMENFYTNIKAGQNIYDAFHSAQKVLFDNKLGNPQIWSSLILIE